MSAFDRRSVLLAGLGLGGVGALAACPDDDKKPTDDPKVSKPGETVPPEGEMSIAEVLPVLVAFGDRLMPTDELGPGAKALGLETYLERTLADPRMAAIKKLLTRGAVFLGRASRQENDGKRFWELSDDVKEKYILRLARNEVRPTGFTPNAFVRVMLALTLESFLGDPRHGGNKDQLGWQFVGGVNWAGRLQQK